MQESYWLIDGWIFTNYTSKYEQDNIEFFRYSLLCEAIDQIAGTGEHLRKVMGLPLKDMGLTKDETASEVEPQVPSQPDSPGTS